MEFATETEIAAVTKSNTTVKEEDEEEDKNKEEKYKEEDKDKEEKYKDKEEEYSEFYFPIVYGSVAIPLSDASTGVGATHQWSIYIRTPIRANDATGFLFFLTLYIITHSFI